MLIAARKHFAALVFGAALAGCSTGDPLTNDLLTQSIATGGPRKSVCAVSGIGDTFSIQKVGVTVFGNALDKAPIDAWDIDDFVTGKIGAQLSQRFDVKRVAYPKGAFAPLDKPKAPLSEPKDDRKDIVRSIAGGKNCDLVVAVTKSGSMIGNSNQHVIGLGILDASSLVFSNVRVFALAEMRVYDGQTFAVLGYKKAFDWQKGILGGQVIRGPSRQADKSWWPASPAHVAGDAKLKQAIAELIEEGIAIMLADLFPEAQASAKR